MFSLITWKFGVQVTQPHTVTDIKVATSIFNHLLTQHSRVQLLLNGNIIKDEVNPAFPNNAKAKVL